MALTNGLRLVPYNMADIATLTATGFTAGLPVTNLASAEPSAIARTTTGTGNWSIKGDWNPGRSISMCALLRHTLSVDATWRLRLYLGTGQTGTLAYDLGTIPMLDVIPLGDVNWGIDRYLETYQPHWFGAAQSRIWMDGAMFARSFQLDITEVTNTAGYWDAGRLVLGAFWQPTTSIDYGATLELVDPSTRIRTEDGNSRLETSGIPYRRIAFGMSTIAEVDRGQLAEILRGAGARRDVYVSAYAGWTGRLERDFEMMANFANTNGLRHDSAAGWSGTIVMEEI